MVTNRRQWLQQSTLAALGLGISLRSLANEELLPRSFGSEAGLINLGSNENPYGISPNARQAIIDMIGQANRYQFNVASVKNFRKDLAPYYGLEPENMLITAGSSEGLNLCARYFADGRLVSATPTFFILPNQAKDLGTEVVEVPLTEGKVHDLDAMLKKVNAKTRLVYIVNPANPTATILKPSQLKDFCNAVPKNTVVLIDEAYIDFLNPPDNESMLSLVHDHPNVLVLRTFSKIHGMAGIRLGFAAGHPSLIKKLGDDYFARTQMCVSNLTMVAAIASLKDEEYRKKYKKLNEDARNYTQGELKKLNLKYIPSYTNFMLFNIGNYNGDFAADMLAKKYIIRANKYDDGYWCRVSFGKMDEMKSFCTTLQSISSYF